MNKKIVKKAFTISASIFVFLVLVLAVHIYIVTRPKTLPSNAVAMARIDFKQDINQADADKITAWLYQQQGVNHVMVNAKTEIAVFSFFPAKADASKITDNLKATFNYKADRYIPTEAEIQSGCPIASNSAGYVVYNFVKRIF
jgi:hypothetical protein